MKNILIFFIFFFLLILAHNGTVDASDYRPVLKRMSVGVLSHDVDNMWSGDRIEGGWVLNMECVFSRPATQFFSGLLQPNLGTNIHTSGDTSSIYGGVIWEKKGKSGVYFITGMDLAWHNGETDTYTAGKKTLGSRVLLRIPFELGYSLSKTHGFSLLFEHKSNGYLCDPNPGMDELGLRYSCSF
jgi:lipid A 3-O-deacylase